MKEVLGIMLRIDLDPELEALLDGEVNDLARYNILRYLHDHPDAEGDEEYFAEQLGLRAPERTHDDFEALARCGLILVIPSPDGSRRRYRLSSDPRGRDLVARLYQLSQSSEYGEIVDRLASSSLKKAKREAAAARSGRRKSNGVHT